MAPVVCAWTAVVALGVLGDLADSAGPAGRSTPAVPVATVEATVRPGETVWDVARRVAPERTAMDADAVVARIVVANGVPAEWLQPGRVIRVPLG